MDYRKLYDLTVKEREILDWRQARRERLRKEYLNSQYNPLAKKPFIDEGVQRWMAMTVTKDQYVGGSVWQAGIAFWIVVGTIAITTYLTTSSRAHTSDKIRRGEIAYADRKHKFK